MYSYLFAKQLVQENSDLLSAVMPDSFEAVVDMCNHYESNNEEAEKVWALDQMQEDIEQLVDCVEHDKKHPIL